MKKVSLSKLTVAITFAVMGAQVVGMEIARENLLQECDQLRAEISDLDKKWKENYALIQSAESRKSILEQEFIDKKLDKPTYIERVFKLDQELFWLEKARSLTDCEIKRGFACSKKLALQSSMIGPVKGSRLYQNDLRNVDTSINKSKRSVLKPFADELAKKLSNLVGKKNKLIESINVIVIAKQLVQNDFDAGRLVKDEFEYIVGDFDRILIGLKDEKTDVDLKIKDCAERSELLVNQCRGFGQAVPTEHMSNKLQTLEINDPLELSKSDDESPKVEKVD